MYRLLRAAFALVCLAASAAGAQMMTVSGSHLTDSTQTPVADATMYWAPVTNAGSALAYRIGGSAGGQATGAPVTTTVTNGVFSIVLPDTAQTSSQNVCFSVTLQDNETGHWLPFPSHTCVQPSSAAAQSYWCTTSTTCNFDLYGPATPAQTVSTPGLPGLSAYQVAQAGGYPGTQAQWLASLVGATGAPGTNGTNGQPLNVRGQWSSVLVYAVGDAVGYTDGNLYVSAVANNTGNTPSVGSTSWSAVSALSAAQVSAVTSNGTYNDTVIGTGTGSPSTGILSDGSGNTRGDNDTFYGSNNMPTPGFTNETTIMGAQDLLAYTGYCGTNAVSQVETGLHTVIGSQNLKSLLSNSAGDCTQPSANTDIVAVGQKVFLAIKNGSYSVGVGNHVFDFTPNAVSDCLIVSMFSGEGSNASCSGSQIFAHGSLANTNFAATNSFIAGEYMGNPASVNLSTLMGYNVNYYAQNATIEGSQIDAPFGLLQATNVTSSQVTGIHAAQTATSVTNSQVVGAYAGSAASSIAESVLYGDSVGGSAGTITNSIVIGYGAASPSSGDVPNKSTSSSYLQKVLAIGVYALHSYFQPTNNNDCGMTAVGDHAGQTAQYTSTYVGCADGFFGRNSGINVTTGYNDVWVGDNSGISGTAQGNENSNTVVGVYATVSPGVSGATQIGQGNNATSNTTQFGSLQVIDQNGDVHGVTAKPAFGAACVAGAVRNPGDGYLYACAAGTWTYRIALTSGSW